MSYRNLKSLILTLSLVASGAAWSAPRDSIRATELSQKHWNGLNQGGIENLTVEFRQGDRLPVVFQTEGDFLKTSEANPSYVVVKRPFWMKITQNQIQMSLDGTRFQEFHALARGSLAAGITNDTSGSGLANAIQLMMKAELK